MLVFSEDYVIYDHKYVCEPHAEYSNPFGMNTKLGGVKQTVSFLNTWIWVVKHTVSSLNTRKRVVQQTTSFPSIRITVVKHTINFLNTRVSVLEHTVKILNTHKVLQNMLSASWTHYTCVMMHRHPPDQFTRLDGQCHLPEHHIWLMTHTVAKSCDTVSSLNTINIGWNICHTGLSTFCKPEKNSILNFLHADHTI